MRRVMRFFKGFFQVLVLALRHRREIRDLLAILGSMPDAPLTGPVPTLGVCDQCLVERRSAPNCPVETIIVGSGPEAWPFAIAVCPEHGKERPWIAEKWALWERLYGGR
jgi:hypothetical protein